jgi:hypothetical protein
MGRTPDGAADESLLGSLADTKPRAKRSQPEELSDDQRDD